MLGEDKAMPFNNATSSIILIHNDVLFSEWYRHTRKKKIRVLLSGVEPKTFPFIRLKISYHIYSIILIAIKAPSLIYFDFKFGHKSVSMCSCSNSLIRKIEQRKSQLWRRAGKVILIVVKFGELLIWISTRSINNLGSFVKNIRKSVPSGRIRFLNT